MPSKPRSRYRVVEKDGKLVVEDLQAETPAARPNAPSAKPTTERVRPRLPERRRRYVGNALFRRTAVMLCGGASTGEGWPVFTPIRRPGGEERKVALDNDGVDRLVISVGLGALAFAFLVFTFGGFALIFLAVFAFNASFDQPRWLGVNMPRALLRSWSEWVAGAAAQPPDSAD